MEKFTTQICLSREACNVTGSRALSPTKSSRILAAKLCVHARTAAHCKLARSPWACVVFKIRCTRSTRNEHEHKRRIFRQRFCGRRASASVRTFCPQRRGQAHAVHRRAHQTHKRIRGFETVLMRTCRIHALMCSAVA